MDGCITNLAKKNVEATPGKIIQTMHFSNSDFLYYESKCAGQGYRPHAAHDFELRNMDHLVEVEDKKGLENHFEGKHCEKRH